MRLTKIKTNKKGEVVVTFRYGQGFGFRIFGDRQEFRAWTKGRRVR